MNNYRVTKKLGEGSFGETFLAVEKSTGHKYAIKKYKTPRMTNRNLERQYMQDSDYKNEIEVLSLVLSVCSHTTPCLRETFEENNNLYIVMDFIDGWEVWDAMAAPIRRGSKRIPLKLRRTTYHRIGSDLITGIYSLHELGVVHQDIKGENIMWDETSGTFKFIDFGLACILSKGLDSTYGKVYNPWTVATPCGVAGNLFTAAPETLDINTGMSIMGSNSFPKQWLRAKDIWAVGCVLLSWFSIPDTAQLLQEDDYNILQYGLSFNTIDFQQDFDEIKAFDEKIYRMLITCFQRNPEIRILEFDNMCRAMLSSTRFIAPPPDWNNVSKTVGAQKRLETWQLDVLRETIDGRTALNDAVQSYRQTPIVPSGIVSYGHA